MSDMVYAPCERKNGTNWCDHCGAYPQRSCRKRPLGTVNEIEHWKAIWCEYVAAIRTNWCDWHVKQGCDCGKGSLVRMVPEVRIVREVTDE